MPKPCAAIPGAALHVAPGMGLVMTSPGLPEQVADLIRQLPAVQGRDRADEEPR